MKLKVPENIVFRNYYLDAIRPFVGKPLIKAITGQRRVGKSYLLYQLMIEFGNRYPDTPQIYLNKEDINFDYIKNARDLYNYIKQNASDEGKVFVFIDEIQEIEDFENALRSLLLEEKYDIYCTGSNAKMLSGDLATLLSGRYIEIPVNSLSYKEFLEFYHQQSGNESLFKFLTYGGLPQLSRLGKDEEVKWEYLRNIVNTIVYKDVIMKNNVRNTRFLDSLIRFLADNVEVYFQLNG